LAGELGTSVRRSDNKSSYCAGARWARVGFVLRRCAVGDVCLMGKRAVVYKLLFRGLGGEESRGGWVVYWSRVG
jgi:hypothetical protein